jgi:hypothetical protein
MQIPAQTAAPQKICPEVSAKFNNRPDMASGVRIVDPPGHQYEAPNTDPTTFLNMKRLLARLPKSSERAGMLLQHRYAIGVGNVQLELRNGPAIIRRWSQRGHEIYTAEGYTLSTTIQSTWFIGRKSTICITILYHTAYALNFSIQFNMHFSTVVSLDNPAFKAVQAGDIEQVKQTISSGLLAVSATIPGGYTLLHVSINILRAYEQQANHLLVCGPLWSNRDHIHACKERSRHQYHKRSWRVCKSALEEILLY